MTEQEWFACEDPDSMLAQLGELASDRKHRLFACMCARRIWNIFPDDHCRTTIEYSERFADGMVAIEELEAASKRVHELQEAYTSGFDDAGWAKYTAFFVTWYSAAPHVDRNFATSVAGQVVTALAANSCPGIDIDEPGWEEATSATRRNEAAAQADLLRDIFGNPFRPITFDPAWRTDTALTLARQMYESRDFGAMPILADALQDAGCEDADILSHCRDASQPHVRGCWVVDLVLGKQ